MRYIGNSIKISKKVFFIRNHYTIGNSIYDKSLILPNSCAFLVQTRFGANGLTAQIIDSYTNAGNGFNAFFWGITYESPTFR